jgi:sterol desaturase/sphingolipid hydroxylase (fatty acid hydroxylase superfamily)
MVTPLWATAALTLCSKEDETMTETLTYLTIGLIPGLILLDWAIRGRKHDSTRFWRLRATLVTIGTFYLAGYVAMFWGTVLGDFHLFDGSGLGTWGGALVGILVYESLLGLPVEAGVLGALFLTFNAMFQHMGMKTPRWLGYIIQRPESHSVHHGKGIHRYNYSDLPLWDMVFGTFRNPREFQPEHGFYPGASGRLTEMLTFQDVTSPKQEINNDQAITPGA